MKRSRKIRQYIKIAEGTIRACNEQGILHSVSFFLKLKTVNSQGYFPKGRVVPLTQSKIQMSQASIWRHFRILQNLGLIVKSDKGYRLRKYDDLFQVLGHDMTSKGNRKGSFKIFKIDAAKIDDLVDEAITCEIDLNLKRQSYNALRATPKKRTARIHLQFAKDYLDERKLTVDDMRKRDDDQFKKEMEGSDQHNHSIDVTLSCIGLANLIGYKAQSQGSVVQRRLVELGLISSTKRLAFEGTFLGSYVDFRKKYASGKFFLHQGVVMRALPNKIVVL